MTGAPPLLDPVEARRARTDIMIDDAELAEELRDRDLASAKTLARARSLQAESGGTLYHTLIDLEMVDEDRLVDVASEILNVASVDLEAYRPNAAAVKMVPRSIALRNQALPLETETDEGTERLVLAMSDPIDMLAMDEVASHTGIDIRPVLAGPRKLQNTLLAVYGEHEDSEAEALDEFFNSCIGDSARNDTPTDPDSLSGFDDQEHARAISLEDEPHQANSAETSPHDRETLPHPSHPQEAPSGDPAAHERETVPRPLPAVEDAPQESMSEPYSGELPRASATPKPAPADSDAPSDGSQEHRADEAASLGVVPDNAAPENADDEQADSPGGSPIGRIPVKKVLVRRNSEDSQFTIEQPPQPGELKPPEEHPPRDHDAPSPEARDVEDRDEPEAPKDPDSGDAKRESRLRGLLDKIKGKSGAPAPREDDKNNKNDKNDKADEKDENADTTDDSLAARLAAAAEHADGAAPDADTRARLENTDRQALLEAAAVAMVRQGLMSIDDLLDD